MLFRILVATYSDNVTTLAFDTSFNPPSLKVISSVITGQDPSWITFHPTDKSLVYACLELDPGIIVVLKYDEEGKGKIVAEGSAGGAITCHLLATQDELFTANYTTGVGIVPISTEEPYLPGKPSAVIVPFDKPGPHPRQIMSHPHQVVQHGSEILVPDLGADKIWRLTKKGGAYDIVGRLDVPLGNGPRHIIIYNDILYVLNELSSTLSSYPLSVLSHPLSSPPTTPALTTLSTLLNPPPVLGDRIAAEILLPLPNPTFPTPYIYISNRNDPSPLGDSISIFSLSPTTSGEVTLIGEVRTGLRHLRGMVFGGEDDKWLIAGGQYSGEVKVFERVDGGKGLVEVCKVGVESPAGFLWL